MMLKKVFSFFEKYFSRYYKVERFDNCIYCNVRLKGNQRKFCSSKCNQAYWRKVYAGDIDRYSNEIKPKNNVQAKLEKLNKKQLLEMILKGGLCKECKRKLHLLDGAQ